MQIREEIMRLGILLFLLLLTLSCNSKQIDPNVNLIIDAEKMAQSMISKDYEKYKPYIYKGLLNFFGSYDNVISMIITQRSQMEQKGIFLTNVEIEIFDKIYEIDSCLQCIISQNITLETADGIFLSEGYLLAISENQGENWQFVDIAGRNTNTFKMIVSNLHPDILIPELKKPVLIKRK
jgi:hypothetical protein